MEMRTIAALWASYRRDVLPAHAPEVQVTECRRAFYAGVYGVLGIVLAIGEDDVTEDEGFAQLVALQEEYTAFRADLLEGRA